MKGAARVIPLSGRREIGYHPQSGWLDEGPSKGPLTSERASGPLVLVYLHTLDNMRTIDSWSSSAFASQPLSPISKTLQTSVMAAHSIADPRAMEKKRFSSAGLVFPTPSAMFNGIDSEARLN